MRSLKGKSPARECFKRVALATVLPVPDRAVSRVRILEDRFSLPKATRFHGEPTKAAGYLLTVRTYR
jgi:hypothetical protein